MRRSTVSALIALAALGWLLPWGLYSLGLNNIEGRPSPPAAGQLSPEDDTFLRHELRAQYGFSVAPLSPGSYFVGLLRTQSKKSAEESGADAAWWVARNYNSSHLHHKQAIWWHLSGAALTIWITRNWTPEQILSRAVELARQHPNPKRSSLQQG